MTLNAKINRETKLTVKVDNKIPVLNPTTLTVKNQFREYQINSIEDLPDVDEVNVTDGALLIYNQTTDKYEVKEFTQQFIVGAIDGGEF
jgi:phosphoribosylformylglycinamidine (FGAM) synthase PurS component